MRVGQPARFPPARRSPSYREHARGRHWVFNWKAKRTRSSGGKVLPEAATLPAGSTTRRGNGGSHPAWIRTVRLRMTNRRFAVDSVVLNARAGPPQTLNQAKRPVPAVSVVVDLNRSFRAAKAKGRSCQGFMTQIFRVVHRQTNEPAGASNPHGPTHGFEIATSAQTRRSTRRHRADAFQRRSMHGTETLQQEEGKPSGRLCELRRTRSSSTTRVIHWAWRN